MKHTLISTFATATLSLLAFSFGGCGGDGPPSAGPEPRVGDESAAPADEDEFAVLPGSLPKEFPDEVPIYPGARVLMATRSKGGYQASLLTEDSFDRVADFYHEEALRRGWEVLTADTLDVAGRKLLRLVAVTGSHKLTFEIAPAVGHDGGTRAIGITIHAETSE